MKNNRLTVVILTFNEELHIERCISSLNSIADRICICDSFSTDNTVELAKAAGADVLQNPWTNHAQQFNWALDNFDIDTEWIMRMDADEFLTLELAEEIHQHKSLRAPEISHYYIKRRVHFMGKWIRRGDYYPVWLLRIWNDKSARCEARWMDEHIKVNSGSGGRLLNDFVDENLNDLTWWTDKHNRYATREAVDILNTIYGFTIGDEISPRLFGSQAERKRWFKMCYVKLPLFFRPILYFIYRYFLKLGFLDGKAGLIWHCLQGGWYRFLADAKIAELYYRSGKDPEHVLKHINEEWGLKLDKK